MRETNTAVNTLASSPMISVTAKPRIGPVPNCNSSRAEMSDETWVSTIVHHTRSKPALMAARAPRWLVLATGSPPLALAFHDLDGHVRVPSASIIAEGRAGGGSLRGMVPLPGGTHPIVDLPAARAEVHILTGHADVHEERQ